jgi:hypothetical protein
MKKISRSTRTSIIFLLLTASVSSFFIIENDTASVSSVILFFALFLGFIIYLNTLKSRKHRQNDKIVAGTEKVLAKILAVKKVNLSVFVIQFLINLPTQKYISGLVVRTFDSEEINKYQAGKSIYVYINPKDPNDIIIPLAKKEIIKPIGKRSFGGALITIIIIFSSVVVPIGIPVIIGLTDTSDREFQDEAFICANDNGGMIWEVRVKQYDKIYIKIYDPVNQEKEKSIKETRDDDDEGYMYLFLCQQKNKVFVVGTGTSPVIYIYDAVSYEKLMDIKQFEQSNSFLIGGIAEIQRKHYNKKIIEENIIEITTKDGNKYIYNITGDKFYNSEWELSLYLHQVDSVAMSKQLFAFVLSKVPEGVEKSQLNMLQSTSTKSVRELLDLANSQSLNVDYFNHNRRYYQYCELIPLSGDKFFLKADIIYTDSSLAVLMHVESLGLDAEKKISGINTKGKTVFTLTESDFPNHDDMQENGYDPMNENDRKCIRYKNQIIFMFSKYGALSVDLATGTQLWKYEP